MTACMSGIKVASVVQVQSRLVDSREAGMRREIRQGFSQSHRPHGTNLYPPIIYPTLRTRTHTLPSDV